MHILNKIAGKLIRSPKAIRRILENRIHLMKTDLDETLHDQERNFSLHNLDRESALENLDELFKSIFGKRYDENDQTMSEHFVIFSALSQSKADINRILEIGTFDGRSAKVLSSLFPDSEIVTIDLPSDHPVFTSTYHRDTDSNSFIEKRDEILKSCNNVEFRELDSIRLTEWTPQQFDMVWVDGAHGYPMIAIDLMNAFRLCRKGGYVLCDDVWHKVSGNDAMYKSIGSFETLEALKSSGLIEDYTLFRKRIGNTHNIPNNLKYVAMFNAG